MRVFVNISGEYPGSVVRLYGLRLVLSPLVRTDITRRGELTSIPDLI